MILQSLQPIRARLARHTEVLNDHAESLPQLRRIIAAAFFRAVTNRQAVAKRDPRARSSGRKIVKATVRAGPKSPEQEARGEQDEEEEFSPRNNHDFQTPPIRN